MNSYLTTVKKNICIAKNIFLMELVNRSDDEIKAGQFINIKIDGFFLRRPISICDFDNEKITIIYKSLGEGTKALSKVKQGENLSVLSALGNGFDIEKSTSPLIIGGGMGVAPLFGLCKSFLNKGINPTVILGYSKKDEMFYIEEFKKLTKEVYVSCDEKSDYIYGTVIDALKTNDSLCENFDEFFSCGPLGMLRGLNEFIPHDKPGQISLEERMGCGFGVCMGCSTKTKSGNKRICKEGPVLNRSEIIW